MRLTRYSHSCVRLEIDGVVIVIDPGIWNEPKALDGADAVLITHEHADHADQEKLAGLSCPVFAPAGTVLPQIEFHPAHPGQRVTVAGLETIIGGGHHAPVLDDQQVCANVGYLIAGTYHPGDALDVAPGAIQTLLVPLQASWLKTSEGVAFLHTSRYERAIGIHDSQINDRAIASINHWYGLGSSGKYEYELHGSVC